MSKHPRSREGDVGEKKNQGAGPGKILLTGILTWVILSMVLGVLEAFLLLIIKPEDAGFSILFLAIVFYGLPGLLGGLVWGFLSCFIPAVRRTGGGKIRLISFFACSWAGFLLLYTLGLNFHQGLLFEIKGFRFLLFFLLILVPLSLLASILLYKLSKRILSLRPFSYFIGKRGVATTFVLLFVLFLSSLYSPELSSIISEIKFSLSRPFGDYDGSLKGRPNIILIVLDTVRRDRLSCYGYSKTTTPNIDRLAQQGVLFKNAYSSSCWTPPAHSSLFTGNYPSKTGVLGGIRALPESNLTLAEILKREQYITLAVAANSMISASFGYGQGFYAYDELYRVEGGYKNVVFFLRESFLYGPLQNEPRTQPFVKILSAAIIRRKTAAIFVGSEFSAVHANERVFFWLDRIPRDRPFFFFINYLDAHSPYDPPDSLVEQTGKSYDGWIKGVEGFELMDALRTVEEELKQGSQIARSDATYLSDLYDGEIRFLDQKVGELVNGLRERSLMDNTLLIITSDHGEQFGEHKLMEHRNSLYEELVRIPLLFYYPGQFSPSAVPVAISLCDVPVTILDLLQIQAPEDVQGRSLLPLLNGGRYGGKVLAEWMDLKTILKGGWKYIFSPSQGREELYSISGDPGERVNRLREEEDIREDMKNSLVTWMDSFEPQEVPDREVEMNESMRERLRALGYID